MIKKYIKKEWNAFPQEKSQEKILAKTSKVDIKELN